MNVTCIRRQVVNILTQEPLSCLHCVPPTSTLQVHSTPWFRDGQRKWPNFFFANTKCTISSPTTYSYMIFLISIGNWAKNALCICICADASDSPSNSLEKLITLFLCFNVPWLGSPFLPNIGLFGLSFSFLDGAGRSMSCGTQRMVGNKVDNFLMALLLLEVGPKLLVMSVRFVLQV